MAERRQSTRGRPPNYNKITLNSTCVKWFGYPTIDPFKSDNNISKLHQTHYKDSCLRRLLEENNFEYEENPQIAVDKIQKILKEYLKYFPNHQQNKLFTEYYTEEYLKDFYQRFFINTEKPQDLIPLDPVFKPIESILNTLHPFKIEKDFDLNTRLTLIHNHIRDSWNKRFITKTNEYYIYNIYFYTILIILEIEKNPKQLRNRKLLNTFSILQVWQSTFPKKFYYILSNFSDEISILLHMLHTYFGYRLKKYNRSSEKIIYPPLIHDEFIEVLQLIQKELILILGIQSKIHTPPIKNSILHHLKSKAHYKEIYQYIWYLSMFPIHIGKEIKVLSEEKTEIECTDLFSSIHEHYKDYKSSLITKCSLLKRRECDLINLTRKEMISNIKTTYKVYTPDTSWEDPNERYIKIEVKRKHTLIQLFKYWYTYWFIEHNNDINKKIYFWLNYFDVTFEGEEGFFVGVQTDLLQTCMNQLDPKISNIFIPTHESSDRYQINRDFTLSKEQLNELDELIEIDKTHNRLTKRSSKLFMEFLGGLISRCVLSSVEMPMKLSYFTLAYLYTNNHFVKNDYGFYFSMDYLPNAKPLLNLLTYDPSILEDTGIEFNDQYPLVQVNIAKKPHRQRKELKKLEINQDTILDYINSTGYYVLTTLNMNDPSMIGEEARKTYREKREIYMDLLDSFNKGFFIHMYGTFSLEQLTINMFDMILCQGGVMMSDLNDFVKKNLKVVYSQDNGTECRTNEIQIQRKIVKWFKHLLTHPVELPYEEFIHDSSQRPTTKEQKEQYYYRIFLPKLMYFWSSSRSINESDGYTLDFKLNDPMEDPSHKVKQFQMMPIAHTCSKTLDIPTYLIDLHKDTNETWDAYFQREDPYEMINQYLESTNDEWQDVLLKRLCKAIYETAGFGMAGGKQISNKCLTYVQQKCNIEKDYNQSFLCGMEYKLKCDKKFTPKQIKQIMTYAKKNTIDFEHSSMKKIIQWIQTVYKKSLI